MYSNNLFNLISEYWDQEQKLLNLNFEDDIIQGCVITHQGDVVNETIRKHYT
jgi:NAD(P) transhydrogenase subunit alpha